MLRHFTALIVGTALIFPTVAPAFAATTIPPLTFNVVSALAKEKDMDKGLKTALKDQNTAWFWELGGGVEKAMTGNNEAEFTEALGKNVATVKTLYTLGMQYAEGKYGDMALTLADEAVGKLNNPAATAVWEMIKLTNQSYKALEATGAALNIEMLYNTVNTDRKLIGKSKGGAPPTIDVNKQKVDYFFNKYLITNGSVRAMVKSYVETTLGGTWPEESWNDYMIGMRAIGSGIDTKVESELRQLQSDEFRNTARGWIRSLLMDVNKQVTLEYYRMRVRQEMAEYAKYANKVGTYYSSGYPMMWEIMRKKKAALKKIPEYKARIKQAQAVLLKVDQAYAAAKDDREKKEVYSKWYPALNELDLATLSDSAETYLLDNDSVYKEIEKVRSGINKRRGLLAKVVEEIYDGEPEIDPKWTGQRDDQGRPMPDAFTTNVMLAKYFTPHIVVEDLDTYESSVKSAVEGGVKLLNKGDFDGANALWAMKLGDTDKSVWVNVYGSMNEAHTKIYDMCAKDPEKMTDPDLKAKAAEHGAYMKAGQSKLSQKGVQYYNDQALKNYIEYWGYACKQGKLDLDTARDINIQNMTEMSSDSVDVMQAFKEMRKDAQGKYSQTMNVIDQIKATTEPTEKLQNKETSTALLYTSEEKSSKGWCPSAPITKDQGLFQFGGYLSNVAMLLYGYGSGESYFQSIESSTNETIKKHETAAELWNDRVPLTSEDISMISVFVDGSENFADEVKDINKHVGYIESYISAERSDLKKYISKARPAYNECADEDERLTVYSKAFKKWQAQIIKSGLVKIDAGKLVAAKINVDASGMALVDKPYKHYLTTSDLTTASADLKKVGLPASLRSYIASKYPVAHKEYQDIFELKGIIPARGPNIALRNVIYLDDVQEMRVRFEDRKWDKGSYERLTDGSAEKFMDKAAVAFPEIVQKHGVIYLIFIPQPSGIEAELESETGKAYVALGKTIKRRWVEHTNAITAAMRKKDETAQEKWKEEQEKLGKLEPIDASGYWVVDARLNYKAYPASGSRTILTKNNLQAGKIYFSGRINTLDNVEKILFSIDGGRSWQERQRAWNITLEVTPTEGKEYEPVIKLVRAEGFDPIVLSLSNDTKVKYSNESYTKRIVSAMKTIAETYERQNLSGFTNLISSGFIGGRMSLEEGVRFDFEMFTNIQLKLYISRITKTRDGKFVVSTKWDKTHIPRSTGSQQKTSGSTVITLVREGEGLKIQNLRGDLLYATLSPDIAAASGLSTAVVNEITTARDNRTPSQPGAGGFTGTTDSSSASSSLLSVRNVSKDYTAHHFYDFDNATWSTPAAVGGSDMAFEATYGPIFEAGTATYVKMASTFDALSTAPDAGYAVIWPALTAGEVYAFKTGAGLYGKFKLDSSTDISGGGGTNRVVFRYSIQTDGSKNIATQ